VSQSINLEYLRKQAKSILKQCRDGDAAAIDRIRRQLPSLDAARIQLADIHHALAREEGYPNWAELKRHDAPVSRFLAAIRGGNQTAAQMELHRFPTIPQNSIHAACAIGHAEATRQHLNVNPSSWKEEEGGWPPLLYACASPFHALSERQAAGLVECITLLMDFGADPQTPSALRRAIVAGNRAVAIALYQRGARPVGTGEGPSSKEAFWGIPQDPTLLDNALADLFRDADLVEEMRQRTREGVARLRRGGWLRRDPDGSISPKDVYAPAFPANQAYNVMIWELLIRRGVQPDWSDITHDSPLHHLAMWDGSAETMEFFLSHGANPNLTRVDGKTPYYLAVRSGNAAVADVLRTHGANLDSVRPADELIGACRRVNASAAASIVRSHPGVIKTLTPEDYEVFVRSAAQNRLDTVKLMLDAGFDPAAFGEGGATALHGAAWHGHVQMVRLLLASGAPAYARDSMFGNSPLDWAVHGSTHGPGIAEDYALIEKMLTP
jgi:hypothetical protein